MSKPKPRARRRARVRETAWAVLNPDPRVRGRFNRSGLGGLWTFGTRKEARDYISENGEMYRPIIEQKHLVRVRITEIPAKVPARARR